jgi:RHH-type proline utilization regulon transcriptional repressor/proline dehydrogenase/delta 1-pyrroline-5-carboxylate dehydrogenase
MIPGMAYLVRRLLENTSNESWLKAGFLDNADAGLLLRSPHGGAGAGTNGSNGVSHGRDARATEEKPDLSTVAKERHRLSAAVPGVGDGRAFFNEPMRDFSRRDVREAFAKAVAGARYEAVANDTTVERAGEMVRRAHAAFDAWRDVDAKVRADAMVRAAAAMRARRDELSGVMIKESGKTWREADADVCEAIDFCEYYAREAVRLFERSRIGAFLGELDEQWYQPRGVAVVIAPWNFPLAICCGMTVAALMTGNTAVVKPAEQTPQIAKIMHGVLVAGIREALAAAGQARAVDAADVVHFCPAPGETVGAALVRDPRVGLVAFTGSKAVGLNIVEAAGKTPEGQEFVKKVICEMGGKNALIVDTSADLDEAVLAIRHSAFGFQGQKCSANSRLIVVDPEGENGPAIRHVISRLVEATRALVIGDPVNPGTDVGPVIDAEAQANILRHIQRAKDEGCRVELAMTPPAGAGPGPGWTVRAPYGRDLHYVAPHIFSGVTEKHALSRDEVFGPVLAVMHAPSFEAALEMANSSPYKLTGGLFSRRPAHIEAAKRGFRVGNLYINRGITGALVARQPFGGFGMSGVGSKAGGVDYLLQFVEPRACCENTMRRGFAPEL